MFSLVYVSRSEIPPACYESEIQSIRLVSIDRNSRLGITGLLVSAPDYFAQLLEGRPDDVNDVMRSIAKDPRHSTISVVRRNPEGRRLCPRWWMAHFSDATFGEHTVRPILKAAHDSCDEAALSRLDRLISAVAKNNVSSYGLTMSGTWESLKDFEAPR